MVLTDIECEQVRQAQGQFGRELCQRTLAARHAGHLQFALSALWLDTRVAEANERLHQAYAEFVAGIDPAQQQPGPANLKANGRMTPELADRWWVKWSMRMWLRIYYLFNDESNFFPGRLNSAVQGELEDLFWNYGCRKSTVQRAQLKYIWCIQVSENHDMMDLGNAFLALQALQHLGQYRDKKLPDGHTPRQHAEAWTEYYKLYCDERARGGLYIEIDSPGYGKYFLPELVNMYDFAEDGLLRRKMEMLLHLTWADWAIDQLGGVRGGAKTRCYQRMGQYSQLGTSSSWRAMGLILIGRGDWYEDREPLAQQVPGAVTYGYDLRPGEANYVLGTTGYRLPDVVIDLALSPNDRGEYVYRSLRPGKMVDAEDAQYIWLWGEQLKKNRPSTTTGIWYDMDADDPHLVRYDYCTPDYIMGSLWLDPEFGTAFRIAGDLDYAPYRNYAAISAQNHWQGLVFPTHPNARVYPQCVGSDHNTHPLTFNQHVAVQHENVMLIQKNRGGNCARGMRVFFCDGMKARLVEDDGWVFVQEGNAYLAVRPLARLCDETMQGYTWDDDNWLHCRDEYAPVVFVAGRVVRYHTLSDFIACVKTHQFTVRGGVLNYSFIDSQGKAMTLTMYVETARSPQINGTAIVYSAEKVFDSPFVQSQWRSGVVEISKDSRKLTLDFNKEH